METTETCQDMTVSMPIPDSVYSHSVPVQTKSCSHNRDLAAFVTINAIIVGEYDMGHIRIPSFLLSYPLIHVNHTDNFQS